MTTDFFNALEKLLPAMKNGFVVNTFDGAFHVSANESLAFVDLARQILMQRLTPVTAEPFSKTFNTEKGQIVALLLPDEQDGSPTLQLFLQPKRGHVLQKAEMHYPDNELGWSLARVFLKKMDTTMAMTLCTPLFEKVGGAA